MEELVIKNSIVVLGVMFASILTGFFSFINLVSSKEQKVSEFRQEWVKELRNSIAEYIATLQQVTHVAIIFHEDTDTEMTNLQFSKEIESAFISAIKAYNDIVLRVNSCEKNANSNQINNQFLTALEKTRELFNHDDPRKLQEVNDSCEALRAAAKPLLKSEWNRVKDGEPVFRWSKNVAIALLILSIGAFIYSAHRILLSVPVA
ncbi:hypothetical protein [Vibrio jasicida]|uniref:hypothetical protein n=1 Tax=Vibrio jasicida TaxID=766224 RepID=UPI000CE542D4|nr:hypothetical protein [Vibrio jasicida]